MNPPARLKLLASNSTRAVLGELLPAIERSTGVPIAVSYEPAKITMAKIAAGETADLIILNQSAVDELEHQGKLTPESRRTLARCGVGVGVRAGAPRPEVGTVEAFRQALLEAKAIAYTSSGASGLHFAGLIEQLGVAAEVKAKSVTQPGGLVGEILVRGEADLAIQQIPELLAVPGVDLVGPLPQALQSISVVVGGVFAGSEQRAAAEALLAALATPEAARVFRARGLEPV